MDGVTLQAIREDSRRLKDRDEHADAERQAKRLPSLPLLERSTHAEKNDESSGSETAGDTEEPLGWFLQSTVIHLSRAVDNPCPTPLCRKEAFKRAANQRSDNVAEAVGVSAGWCEFCWPKLSAREAELMDDLVGATNLRAGRD